MKVKLDPDQQKAVEHFEGPALVVAGPGSGKTTVIKERILNLIQEYNVNPRQILALAFNKEAVKEMEKRILSELVSKSKLPEIRTLHAFSLRIINEHYDRLKWQNKPEIWPSDPERTIKQEIRQLKRNIAGATVTIYKIESELTGKCYIGQTTNPKRRKREHFSFDDSSNPDLRQAMLNEGKEHFKFYCIDKVESELANRREAKYIEYYRNRAVINLLEPEVEQLETDAAETYISIYKIESKKTGICYIVQSTDSERSKVEDFTDSSNDIIRKAIEIEDIEQFTLETLHKEVLSATASTFAEQAIKNASSRSRAVFNRNNPLRQRYSDQLMIELFCEHFNIRYEELLKRPSGVKNLIQKIEDFEKIVNQVQKAKQQAVINSSETDSIDDFVNSIIESIDDRIVQAFAEKYEKKKKNANAIDFQDMILYAVYLLETCPDISANVREKYDYVLIDEFQDISPIDFRLVKPLSENLFAVGDDDQAIYGFRGGDSKIMLDFHKREDVKKYKITRNYRSSPIIVEHSKALIEHNPIRIGKNLRTNNPMRMWTRVLETTEETLKSVFLREFAEPLCQTQFIDNHIPILGNALLKVPTETQKIGIPVRYRSEVEKLRQTFLSSGFKEIKGKSRRKKGDSFKFIGRSTEEIIEGRTIHSVKGKEYDKVILIHNTLGEDFPFHNSDNIIEERRVFYVAMTRVKQELLVLGGNCQFVEEAGLTAITPKRKRQLERVSRALGFAIVKRIDIAKKQVETLSENIQPALTSALSKVVRKQHEYELDRLRSDVTKTKNAAEDAVIQLETKVPIALKAANENLLKGLIPVMDAFESQINNAPEATEADNVSADFAELHQNLQHVQQQLLRSLDNYGLKPIETCGKIFNPSHHEEVLPAIYSDEVEAGWIAREERRGYLLHNQVVRKAQVVISKGEYIQIPERLDGIIEIYLDRLISAFQNHFQLTDIDKPFIIRQMTQYLSNLDNESIRRISLSAIKGIEVIDTGHFADYCVGPEKTHLCTDVFRNFWERMWEVVEQSRKGTKPQTETPSISGSFKIKQVETSVDEFTFIPKKQKKSFGRTDRVNRVSRAFWRSA